MIQGNETNFYVLQTHNVHVLKKNLTPSKIVKVTHTNQVLANLGKIAQSKFMKKYEGKNTRVYLI